MLTRIAKVNNIKINIVSFSSTFQIGDSDQIVGSSNILATQKGQATFLNHEGNFNDYHIFTEQIPSSMIDEQLQATFVNEIPFIKVGDVNLIGLSFSSVLQVGNSENVCLEARVKHIRHLTEPID